MLKNPQDYFAKSADLRRQTRNKSSKHWKLA
jgi:hypothetical protein